MIPDRLKRSDAQGRESVAVSNPDGSNIGGGTTSVTAATITQIAASASNVTLAVSNTSRNELVITNDSTQVLYIKLGATATSSSYSYKLNAGDILELPKPVYTGQIDGIWASANGNALVTEF